MWLLPLVDIHPKDSILHLSLLVNPVQIKRYSVVEMQNFSRGLAMKSRLRPNFCKKYMAVLAALTPAGV